MEGNGFYVWNDGRKYEGQYKDDKKHGFGIYTWADGRCYEGYWWKGKQHGLGTYFVPKEGKVKYGLWEDGKRIEWFNEEDVADINLRRFEYKKFFNIANSADMVMKDATLQRPLRFDDRMLEIRRQVDDLRQKITGTAM
jgi:hypothetical protein